MSDESHNKPESHDGNDFPEESLAQALNMIAENTPTFRADIADSVSQSAGDVFEAHAANEITPSEIHESNQKKQQTSQGRFPMIAKIGLALSLLVGAVTLVFNPVTNASDSLTFGEVLDRTFEAKTLHLKIASGNENADVWIDEQRNVRQQQSPTRYLLAKGTRLWEIDEETNTIESRESLLAAVNRKKQIDLIQLLCPPEKSAGTAELKIRDLKPAETTTHAGKECYVYSFEDREQSRLYFNAFVSVKDRELQTIAAWATPAREGVPVAELTLVARDVDIDESKFVVADTLSEDGRIGKLVDAQGIVTLRPVMASRWTPVKSQMLIEPGDLIRTDNRGANATSIILTSQYKLVVGPGSLVELQSPARIKLHGGEVKIITSKKSNKPLELIGAKGDPVKIEKTVHYLMDADRKLQVVKKKPLWLSGFEGATTNDSIGSLIAKVDGRDVPLTVGYHKVNVEIRDQIARTTIEESFVNRTKSQLEGVFHFPLPQDASISGFGMWINGELIEADVVEKQRAREIYETILREKRDPGLLEWTGGNIFKARVFPILPHSEKRIRIVYTQVLPLRANRYRYSYGLRSEMLQKTPCRELSVNVQINSAIPLKSVNCVSHPVRSQVATHSAQLEFSEQEYTPTRDFEVTCEVDSTQSDVVAIPHRRGDDGYFLIQLTPPGADGNWQRELLPDGKPLEVLVVCDTSASMDSTKRKQQEEFLASLLNSMGDKDRFNVAVCDVECEWLSKDLMTRADDAINKTIDWLRERRSLGWTDLDVMLKSVLEKLNDNSHVIYIGDGIVTANDADPQSFVARLKRMTDAKRQGTFHAISVGSSYESVVLKAVSRVGGGSIRQIGGEQTPQTVAFELLNEIAQPGVRDLKVEFRGLQVAAIYPDQLPNLAAGKQQILIGRYLPQGEDQTGEIIITGNREGKEVKFASRISLKDAESGNSFIPRLWARAHLDHLLAQGSNQFIKDEIIAMSEEFHIITPYTSLLVLETDADRERFNVKRRFQMRDGERFFADGRDNANYELLQQQMKLAGNWRLGLRRKILANYSRLGRNTQQFFSPQPRYREYSGRDYSYSQGGFGGGGGWGGDNYFGDGYANTWAMNGPAEEMKALREPEMLFKKSRELSSIYDFEDHPSMDFNGNRGLGLESLDELVSDRSEVLYEREEDAKRSVWYDSDVDGLKELELGESIAGMKDLISYNGRQIASKAERWNEGYLSSESSTPLQLFRSTSADKLSVANGTISGRLLYDPYDRSDQLWGGFEYSRRPGPPGSVSWVQTLFPQLSPIPRKPDLVQSTWNEELVALSKSLQQKLELGDGGIEVVRKTTGTDSVWKRVTSRSEVTDLYGNKNWLTFNSHANSQTLVHWCNEEQLGTYSRAFSTGRYRKPVELDFTHVHPGQRPHTVTPIHESYRGYSAEIDRPGENRIVLTLTPKTESKSRLFITIDTQRHVVLEEEWKEGEKSTSKTTYSEHVEKAGVWWPGVIKSFNAKGQLYSETRQTVTVHTKDDFAKRITDESPDPETSLLLPARIPTVREAEIAETDGTAEFAHRLVLLLRSASIQKWDDVISRLEKLEELSPKKQCLKWIRAAILVHARSNNEAYQHLSQLGDDLIANPHEDEYFLSTFILSQVSSLSDWNEQLRIIDQLKPVFERQPDAQSAMQDWTRRHIQALRSLGRMDEVLASQKQLATEMPWDVYQQTGYANDLRNIGQMEAAYTWLQQEIERDVERHPHEILQLKNAYANNLKQDGRDEDYLKYMQDWIATNPEENSVYVRYLGALMFADKVDEANTQTREWLTKIRSEEKLAPIEYAKLSAAISFAFGEGQNYYYNYIDPQWFQQLQETAKYYLMHSHHFDVASRIISHHRFTDSDESDQLRNEIATVLKTKLDDIKQNRLGQFIQWTIYGSALTQEDWQTIAAKLYERWKNTDIDSGKQNLGNVLLQIYSSKFAEEKHLPFMRERITVYIEAEKFDLADQFRKALFDQLLSQKWTEQNEQEALSLIQQLSSNASPARRLFVQIGSLHQFVDKMIESRIQAANQEFQDKEHPENLTRTELAAKRSEFRKAALTGVAKRLGDYLKANPTKDDDISQKELNAWMRLEGIYLDLQLDRKQKQALKICWDMLGNSPVDTTASPDDKKDDDEDVLPNPEEQTEKFMLDQLESLRKARALATVQYLTVRKSADDKQIEQLGKFIDKGVKLPDERATHWKAVKFRFLVALDRPEELERFLREWIKKDEFPAPWQLALGRLRAERGDIKEAITLFETVQKASQLSPSDYMALANWYLVQDQRDKYNSSRIDIYKMMPENRLNSMIRQTRNRWLYQPVTETELDENSLLIFKALFEKSRYPQNYVYELRSLYTASRDFRLLQMVPDAAMGRTPQEIYPFLNQLRSNLLYEIRKEATADELLNRLKALRDEKDSVTDLRALDLLEAMVERQASEVLNQPGPHIKAAVAALKRAFEREWADGEIQQMSYFLRELGTISQQELNAERLRQLRELHGMTKPGTFERLYVAWNLSHTLYWSHREKNEGLTVMQSAIREFEQSNPKGWPQTANSQMEHYIHMLRDQKRFTKAEQELNKHVEKPLNASQKYWMLSQRNQVYLYAFEYQGIVSLGSGVELYQNLEDLLRKQMQTFDRENQKYDAFGWLLSLYDKAKRQNVKLYEKDVRHLAFEILPEHLNHETNYYHNYVSSMSDRLKSLLGSYDSLKFLIERIEQYPIQYEYSWNNPWNQYGYRLAEYFRDLNQNVVDLEPRLLAIVLKELRHDLRTRNSRNRYFYSKRYSSHRFWNAKADDFLRVAEEVLKERSHSARSVTHIASYLFFGLDKHDRAIEVMLIANDKKLLNQSQQLTLVDYLHRENRYAESIPILQPIVKSSPDAMQYRILLLTAYHRAKRSQQVQELLAETDEHFRQKGRWIESNIAQLAQFCLESGFYKDTVKYYDELIPLRKRLLGNRVTGDSTLASYYINLSRAYSVLGKTNDAIDAASAAIVTWGPRHDQRTNAVNQLKSVLSHAKDLDEYVKGRDQETEKTGQDSPLIRQQIGLTYADKNQYEKAIEQLELAEQLQPNDSVTHDALVKSYDALGKTAEANSQILARLDYDRHNLSLYKDLAKRFRKDDSLEERVVTTIVEAAPNEAEHHQALAEIRQEQNRWSDAIEHWKHVAALRSLEPNGLLKLAEAQIHEKRYPQAQKTVDQLSQQEWPERFREIKDQIRKLEQQIPSAK